MSTGKLRLRRAILPLLLTAGLIVALPPAFAQQAASTNAAAIDVPYVPSLTFDVASVRESRIDPNGGITVSGGFTPPDSTSLRITNWSIFNLLSLAYGGLQYYQIDSNPIPQELGRAIFIIQAKGDASADAIFAKLNPEQRRAEQAHMLLALLKDRFKLQAHFETRQGDVYNLVAPKGEAKLRSATRPPPTAEQAKAWADRTPPPLYQIGGSRTEFDYIAHDCQMSDITRMLAGQFFRPVIDKTGFTGKYNFVLKTHWTRQSDRKDDDTNPIPTLEEAIQELGLKLAPAKGPIEVLVVDHVEKPSDN